MSLDEQAGKVMVVGSANMDLVFRCERLPAPGETLLGGQFETAPGGKGANQAAAVGRLGGSVEFVGWVGNDGFGEALVASLFSLGVGTRHLSCSPATPTGVAAVLVDATGQNSIVVAPGANRELTEIEVKDAIDAFKPKVVLAQLEIPLGAVQACRMAPLFVLNPAPAMAIPEHLLPCVTVLTPNESETAALTGIMPKDDESCLSATSLLHARGVRSVVLTLGARGCFVSDSRRAEHFSAPRVDAVDTTAAGDAFSGALAHFLALGRDIWNAAQLANCVAALSTTVKGAQASMPTLQIVRRLAGPLL